MWLLFFLNLSIHGYAVTGTMNGQKRGFLTEEGKAVRVGRECQKVGVTVDVNIYYVLLSSVHEFDEIKPYSRQNRRLTTL